MRYWRIRRREVEDGGGQGGGVVHSVDDCAVPEQAVRVGDRCPEWM